MEELKNWMKQGLLKVSKVSKYPLNETSRAHRDLESEQTVGKLVLTMDKGKGDKQLYRHKN